MKNIKIRRKCCLRPSSHQIRSIKITPNPAIIQNNNSSNSFVTIRNHLNYLSVVIVKNQNVPKTIVNVLRKVVIPITKDVNATASYVNVKDAKIIVKIRIDIEVWNWIRENGLVFVKNQIA